MSRRSRILGLLAVLAISLTGAQTGVAQAAAAPAADPACYPSAATPAPPADSTSEQTVQSIVDYDIWVKTGDLDGAGTDSTVCLKIYGTLGSSPLFQLDDPTKDDRERGQTDHYHKKFANLGHLKKVSVCFKRESGDHYDWQLDWVKVNHAWFPYNGWFEGMPVGAMVCKDIWRV